MPQPLPVPHPLRPILSGDILPSRHDRGQDGQRGRGPRQPGRYYMYKGNYVLAKTNFEKAISATASIHGRARNSCASSTAWKRRKSRIRGPGQDSGKTLSLSIPSFHYPDDHPGERLDIGPVDAGSQRDVPSLGCHTAGSKAVKMVIVVRPQTPARWAMPESLDTKTPPMPKKSFTSARSSKKMDPPGGKGQLGRPHQTHVNAGLLKHLPEDNEILHRPLLLRKPLLGVEDDPSPLSELSPSAPALSPAESCRNW